MLVHVVLNFRFHRVFVSNNQRNDGVNLRVESSPADHEIESKTIDIGVDLKIYLYFKNIACLFFTACSFFRSCSSA